MQCVYATPGLGGYFMANPNPNPNPDPNPIPNQVHVPGLGDYFMSTVSAVEAEL